MNGRRLGIHGWRRAASLALALALVTVAAEAQLGGVLGKIEKHKDKIRKGATVVTAVTHDFTEAEEADIGRVVAARILKTYPLSENDRLQQYVTLVGNTIASYSARPNLDWHFAVIETSVVNAFSAPGGFIFITTGALEQIDSEAELAGVLAHEIAHATEKHILQEIRRANVISAGMDLAKTTSSGSFLNDAVAQKISNLAYEKLFTTGLSRRDEHEADAVGVQLASAAGYRASQFVRFLQSLDALQGHPAATIVTATHPRAADRIRSIEALVRDAQGEVLADRWKEWAQLSER